MYIPGAILERYVCQPFTDPNLEFLDQVCMLVMNQNQQYTGKNIERLCIKKTSRRHHSEQNKIQTPYSLKNE